MILYGLSLENSGSPEIYSFKLKSESCMTENDGLGGL